MRHLPAAFRAAATAAAAAAAATTSTSASQTPTTHNSMSTSHARRSFRPCSSSVRSRFSKNISRLVRRTAGRCSVLSMIDRWHRSVSTCPEVRPRSAARSIPVSVRRSVGWSALQVESHAVKDVRPPEPVSARWYPGIQLPTAVPLAVFLLLLLLGSPPSPRNPPPPLPRDSPSAPVLTTINSSYCSCKTSLMIALNSVPLASSPLPFPIPPAAYQLPTFFPYPSCQFQAGVASAALT